MRVALKDSLKRIHKGYEKGCENTGVSKIRMECILYHNILKNPEEQYGE